MPALVSGITPYYD